MSLKNVINFLLIGSALIFAFPVYADGVNNNPVRVEEFDMSFSGRIRDIEKRIEEDKFEYSENIAYVCVCLLDLSTESSENIRALRRVKNVFCKLNEKFVRGRGWCSEEKLIVRVVDCVINFYIFINGHNYKELQTHRNEVTILLRIYLKKRSLRYSFFHVDAKKLLSEIDNTIKKMLSTEVVSEVCECNF